MDYGIRHLAASPHRMMFFSGALQGVLTVAWRLADLNARHAGWYAPVAWSVPAGWTHAHLMAGVALHLCGWAAGYVPIYWLPRADGRPG
jgi:hypothetical protein